MNSSMRRVDDDEQTKEEQNGGYRHCGMEGIQRGLYTNWSVDLEHCGRKMEVDEWKMSSLRTDLRQQFHDNQPPTCDETSSHRLKASTTTHKQTQALFSVRLTHNWN
ncbi:unnamed protein product [Protopolystoma xenopodis]|uniref:Uncharacterized protein n=1 Tax=Protopolystoma xenopodis TaxID=117903 RepID=A0A448XFL4_9PLAT|nr:unnamed protein product [Protopolystoma xenopodis]